MADGALEHDMKPTEELSVRDVFGIDTDMVVKGFPQRTSRVRNSIRCSRSGAWVSSRSFIARPALH